ncbi:MAG: tellurium resistance protein TerX [Candidatus Cloacimonetes bacterium HGW-Cloacimonetes-3]|jgi:stress response protein SCP2|nr:MAG: tellurium resistance protein TerX [Candidatus Cloacimonetes bacterium HGW-Cloacimonetes-3]
MAIRLQKGQTINLNKEQNDLSQVTIGLGWDVRKEKRGLFSPKVEDYDLDAIAFLLDSDGKVADLGDKLIGGDVVFFNSLKHPSGSIWLTGDNRTGEGEGDDEQIICLLNKIPPRYDKIIFIVTIYQGIKKNQHFGMVENAFIRAVDAKGTEMFRYDLSTDSSYNGKHSMIFAELYRRGGEWKFRALGDPEDTDAFVEILKRYVK